MTTRLVDGGWRKEFNEALRADASGLRIVCPFIKLRTIQSLLCHQTGNVRVITRFNLADFAEGVSDVAALRSLLNSQAKVRGVRNLHAKLYLFGETRAIITSSNLTEAALSRNHELGMVTGDAAIIEKCLAYFDNLWQNAGDDLVSDQAEAWHKTITNHWIGGSKPNDAAGLRDYGVDAGLPLPPNPEIPTAVADAPQAFVKFLGGGDDRQLLSASTTEEIKEGGCHLTACYPAGRRPIGVKDGAVIFMGRFTRDPDNIRVFGRAIGMAYVKDRDDATLADIERYEWRKKWSRYIRVHNAEFVNGTLENGVSLNELMDNLKANSFNSTQRNAVLGEGNTNPRRAYRQQAAVELSAEGFSWLAERLQAAFEAHGKVPLDSIKELNRPDPLVTPSSSN